VLPAPAARARADMCVRSLCADGTQGCRALSGGAKVEAARTAARAKSHVSSSGVHMCNPSEGNRAASAKCLAALCLRACLLSHRSLPQGTLDVSLPRKALPSRPRKAPSIFTFRSPLLLPLSHRDVSSPRPTGYQACCRQNVRERQLVCAASG